MKLKVLIILLVFPWVVNATVKDTTNNVKLVNLKCNILFSYAIDYWVRYNESEWFCSYATDTVYIETGSKTYHCSYSMFPELMQSLRSNYTPYNMSSIGYNTTSEQYSISYNGFWKNTEYRVLLYFKLDIYNKLNYILLIIWTDGRKE